MLDPLIHHPQRLRIVATLAALPDGDVLTVTRLQNMIGLPHGSPIICLPELAQAGYLRTGLRRDTGPATVALTRRGRLALHRYTAMLHLLSQAAGQGHQELLPGLRAGDADREAAAAALREHFALGRLTLDELSARLDAALTATTYGELAHAARDLPAETIAPAPIRLRGSRPAGRGPKRADQGLRLRRKR